MSNVATKEERNAAIREAYLAGARRCDLPEQFGIGIAVVGRALKGLSRLSHARRLPSRALIERNDAMAAAYNDGATIEEVGRQFGLSLQGAHAVLRNRTDVQMRPRGLTKKKCPDAYRSAGAA